MKNRGRHPTQLAYCHLTVLPHVDSNSRTIDKAYILGYARLKGAIKLSLA